MRATGKEITYTGHALDKFVERSLRLDWIERTVREPDFIRPDPVPPAVQAFKAIPEHGARILRVVFVEETDNIRIITAFFDRRAKA
jgi:hypothetical protein